jgi:hypothetical protein
MNLALWNSLEKSGLQIGVTCVDGIPSEDLAIELEG